MHEVEEVENISRFFLYYLVILGIEERAFQMLGRHSTTDLLP
jgi:hypothetical protein